jgi:NTP pyrophosphatase (non-canonical NTP hydrolase)
MSLTLRGLQKQQAEWEARNFPREAGIHLYGYRALLGVAEEAGELAHAHLKGEQGIRHAPQEIVNLKLDAIGDIVVYLAKYCTHEGFDLELAVERAWANTVSKRDWAANPMTGAPSNAE